METPQRHPAEGTGLWRGRSISAFLQSTQGWHQWGKSGRAFLWGGWQSGKIGCGAAGAASSGVLKAPGMLISKDNSRKLFFPPLLPMFCTLCTPMVRTWCPLIKSCSSWLTSWLFSPFANIFGTLLCIRKESCACWLCPLSDPCVKTWMFWEHEVGQTPTKDKSHFRRFLLTQ